MRRIILALILLTATSVRAGNYHVVYQPSSTVFSRCTATWNGIAWVTNVAAASYTCAPNQCFDAAQSNVPPADVQLACYQDPNPAPLVLSNVVRVAAIVPSASPVRSATPTPGPSVTPNTSVAVISYLPPPNDYWGQPPGDPSVVLSARQLFDLPSACVLGGITVNGYGETGATGAIRFELWPGDLSARLDVPSASLDITTAQQPRQYVLGWPGTVTIPPGRYWLRAQGLTVNGRWRWSAVTPGTYGSDPLLHAWTNNTARNSDFLFALYCRTSPASPSPVLTPHPTTTPPIPPSATAIDVLLSDSTVGRFTR